MHGVRAGSRDRWASKGSGEAGSSQGWCITWLVGVPAVRQSPGSGEAAQLPCVKRQADHLRSSCSSAAARTLRNNTLDTVW
jgi:hypothetical protein